MTIPQALRDAANVAKAWPYEEARKLLKRYPDGPGEGGIVFETGYGPSGLPHLGTFQEVARTLMVRHALTEMVDWPTRLIAFSDDMDGMRKVPPNVPHQDMMHEHLDQPLSTRARPVRLRPRELCRPQQQPAAPIPRPLRLRLRIPRLVRLLSLGPVRRGAAQACCANMTRSWAIMLPTLREERRATYSPVLPISQVNGKVLQVPIEVVDAEAGTVRYTDPASGESVDQSILSGGAKLQWKVDWAMRWVALGVDYEMSGKDLIDSVDPELEDRARARRPPARGLQLRDCSSTRMARRFRSRRAMASPSTNG